MVQEGRLGEIRVVQVEYAQDWLTEPLEASGQKQAEWRTDPARAGAGGCIGDIGTHAFQLAGYVAGQPVSELCAELSTFVAGRRLDDNVQVMLRFAGGARGALWASQVAPGNENNLRLRVYGSRGGIEWHQEQPNQLVFSPFGQPTQTIARSGSGAGAAAARVTRPPAGHPRAISKRSRRSTARSPRRSAPAVAAARKSTARSSSRASPTASPGSSSSPPRSPRPGAAGAGFACRRLH
jgi:predicted dehydrogenase